MMFPGRVTVFPDATTLFADVITISADLAIGHHRGPLSGRCKQGLNERENDSQNRYVRISILDNDVCMIMKQYENDEVSKCQK